MRWARAVLAGLLLCGGCAGRGVKPAAQGQVEVEQLEVRFESDIQASLQLTLNVLNPTQQSAALRRVDWELWFSDRQFAAGTQQLQVTLEPAGRQSVVLEVPVAFRRRTLVSEPRPIDVGVRGEVQLEVDDSSVPLKFEWQERRVLTRSLATDVDED
jgi:LEA14-like dessication related protein